MTKRFCHGKKRTNKMLPEVSFWGFSRNHEDNCVYAKFKNWKCVFLIMYVGNILLSGSDVSLLLQTNKILSSKLTSLHISEEYQLFNRLKFTEI
jgi:hypothetical protein